MISNDLMKKMLTALENAGADPETSIEETFMGNIALYDECLEKLPADHCMSLFEESFAAGDTATAIRAVHTLKGIADNLALFPLVDAAVSLLQLLRAGKSSDCEEAVTELKEAYDSIMQIIRSAHPDASGN